MQVGNIKLLGELDATEGTISGAGGGDVSGPESSTSGNIPSFADASGKVLQDSTVSASALSSHLSSTSNPHGVTAAQVGAAAVLSGNTTVNLTYDMTAAQIQALIDAQPKNLNGYTLTFQFGDGTYNTSMTASLNFTNFYNGTLIIQGNTGEADASALHTSQSVYLDFSAGTLSGIAVTNCYVQLFIRNLKIRVSDTAGIRCINLTGCPMAYVQYNYLLGVNNTTTNVGIGCSFSLAYVTANYVSTLQTGIGAFNVTTIYSNGNDDTGTAPKYGLAAQQAGVIGKNGTQPAGTTSSEYISSGGEIR